MARSQNDRILAHMQEGKSITALEAIDQYNILRLAARINDLRKQGHVIKSEIVRYDLLSNRWFTEYSM